MALMRRQSLVKFDAPLCETIVETPKPQGREVLVRIERCGLCHSDLHIQDGYADLGGGKKLDTTRGMTLPFTLGHEIAGVVDEVGPDADKGLIGSRKAVFPWIGCGKCRDCLSGDENLCVRNRYLGVSIDGGFATHVLVPDEKYLLDYDPVPIDMAATLMCSGITAYGALKRLVDRPRQRNLLLIGLGGVGMMGLALAQAMFKQPITVADLSASARDTALKNGAAVAYDPTEPDIVKRIVKETDGGFDEIVDFAGNEKSMNFAVGVVARGGKIVTQATSPLYAHKAFWCIYNTFATIENPLFKSDTASETVYLQPEAYHCYVPSFGSWGFVMASNAPFSWQNIEITVPARFVNNDFIKVMNRFPPDIARVETDVNTIDTHVVKSYYEEGWEKWAL